LKPVRFKGLIVGIETDMKTGGVVASSVFRFETGENLA